MISSVLITGGAGFLGRHLAARLAMDNTRVVVLDDLSSPNARMDDPLLKHPTIERIVGSALDKELMARLAGTHAHVVHFASVVGVANTMDQPLSTARNLLGAFNLCEMLTEDHVLLFGSSADVYGMHSRVYPAPMREDDCILFESPLVRRWVYPLTKSLEEAVLGAAKARGVLVRIFNTYGPGMDHVLPHRVVPAFLNRIRAGLPLLVQGDGRQIRSFCFVSDLVEGLRSALSYGDSLPAGKSCLINLGNDKPISILNLAELMSQIGCQEGLTPQPVPVRAHSTELYRHAFDDTWNRVPDISRAREFLGFSPKVALEEGLRRTMASCFDSPAGRRV